MNHFFSSLRNVVIVKASKSTLSSTRAAFLGSGPNRGRSPVEWRDFLSVRLSVHSSPMKGPRASQAGLRPSQSGLRTSQAGLRASRGGRVYGRTDEQTDGRTDGKSPHSTGLRPLSGPLPKREKERKKKS